MRSNNCINTEGLIGEAVIEVRWQGTRTVCKRVYHNVDEFNRDWCSIDSFWDKQGSEPKKPKLSRSDKELVNRFLARTQDLKLDK